MASSTKRAHTIPFPSTPILPRLETGRGAMLVSTDAVSVSTRIEEHFCQPDVKMVFVAARDCRDHHIGAVLDWGVQITGTSNEITRTEKRGVPKRKHEA